METYEQNRIKYWVKKIFSIQFLSLLVAIAGVIIAYYQFVYNKTPELAIELDSHKYETDIKRENVNDVRNFYGVFFYDVPMVNFGYTTEIPIGIQIPYVHIRNKGKKAITNLDCQINVVYDENFDNEMIGYNTANFQIEQYHSSSKFKYTENVLKAGSGIPLPLVELLLFSLNEESTNEKGYFDLSFYYHLTCDGRSEPLYFKYQMRFYNADKFKNHKSALQLFTKSMINSDRYLGKSVLIYVKQFNGYAVDNTSSTKRFVFDNNTTINDLTKITDEIVTISPNK